jgi:hypothetical protein
VFELCAVLLNLLGSGSSQILRIGYHPAFNFLTLLGRYGGIVRSSRVGWSPADGWMLRTCEATGVGQGVQLLGELT